MKVFPLYQTLVEFIVDDSRTSSNNINLHVHCWCGNKRKNYLSVADVASLPLSFGDIHRSPADSIGGKFPCGLSVVGKRLHAWIRICPLRLFGTLPIGELRLLSLVLRETMPFVLSLPPLRLRLSLHPLSSLPRRSRHHGSTASRPPRRLASDHFASPRISSLTSVSRVRCVSGVGISVVGMGRASVH